MSIFVEPESEIDFLKKEIDFLKKEIEHFKSKLSVYESFPKALYYEAQRMCANNNISELYDFFQRNPSF